MSEPQQMPHQLKSAICALKRLPSPTASGVLRLEARLEHVEMRYLHPASIRLPNP